MGQSEILNGVFTRSEQVLNEMLPETLLAVHKLNNGDVIEFAANKFPTGHQLVIVAWGVRGINGPIAPWMVATRDTAGKVRNFTLDPELEVRCISRPPRRAEE